jgi:hypothetical protein
MNTLWQDLRYGARMLLKTPAVTLVAVIALTLGIGANTALFSVVHAVLLRALPYADGDRLAMVWEHRKSSAGNPQNVINLGNFYDWKEQNSVFVDMAAFFDRNVNLTSDGEPEEVAGSNHELKQGVILGLIGVAAGLIASFGPTRLIVSLLFEVPATDTKTFAAVATGLFLITLLACYIPARRATKVDPLVALRYE